MIRRLLKIFLLLFALGLLISLPTFGPDRIGGVLKSLRHGDARSTSTSIGATGADKRGPPDLAKGVSLDRITHTIESLSRLTSRIPGYPGHETAFRFVHDRFRDQGYTTLIDTFAVTVPIDHGGSLTVASTGDVYPVYALCRTTCSRQLSPTAESRDLLSTEDVGRSRN